MNASRIFQAFVALIATCLFTIYFITPETISTAVAATFTFTAGARNIPAGKTILYWNSFFSEKTFYFGEGYVASHCPIFNNCFATRDRFLRRVETFDAVIFHGVSDLHEHDLPKHRRDAQKYVFVALESPANRQVNRRFDGYFNLTMSYHLDSDVVWTYNDIVDSKDEGKIFYPPTEGLEWNLETTTTDDSDDENLDDIVGKKTKTAVWYRSNCETQSGREFYVAELERHVKVDKFGRCSENPGCARGKNCFKTEVEPDYLFYLSFENSLCEDYVTEKFFNALQYYVVPVVYGGANYTRFAPPKSYINALDFNTPQELGAYLKYLTKNPAEYKRYFDWKKNYRVTSAIKRTICDLCRLINEDKEIKTYEISKWYSMQRCPIQRRLDSQMYDGGSTYATKETASNWMTKS